MAGVRLDLLLLDCVGVLVQTHVEPRAGLPIWDGGLKEVAHEVIKDSGVTTEPLTVVSVARKVGILKPEDHPNEVVIENSKPVKRKSRKVRG